MDEQILRETVAYIAYRAHFVQRTHKSGTKHIYWFNKNEAVVSSLHALQHFTMKLYYRCYRRITMVVSVKCHGRCQPRRFNSQTVGKYALAEQWVSKYWKWLKMMGDFHMLPAYLSIRAPTLDAQIEFEGGRNLNIRKQSLRWKRSHLH